MEKSYEEYKVIVSEGGRISIPAPLRNSLKFKVGDELLLRRYEDGIYMIPLSKAVEEAQELIRRYNIKKESLTESLFSMRKQEKDND